MEPLVVFSHGKDAHPQGRKISHLAPLARRAGWRVMSIDYTDLDDPDERADRLRKTELGPHSRLVLVGSSMGGYVSAAASPALRPDGLFLMAPAFFMPGYGMDAPQIEAEHVFVVSGWNDAVVPVDGPIRFARAAKAELHVFDSDHSLWDVLPQIGDLLVAFLEKVRRGG